MQLNFTFNEIDQLWIDGKLPFRVKPDHKVKLQLSGTSASVFPPILEIGDLLCSERPSPLQHAVTLLLAYTQSTVPITATPAKRDGWYDIPGSMIYGQIRIPLSLEAISQIREVDGEGYNYELSLRDIELTNKTKPAKHKPPSL